MLAIATRYQLTPPLPSWLYRINLITNFETFGNNKLQFIFCIIKPISFFMTRDSQTTTIIQNNN